MMVFEYLEGRAICSLLRSLIIVES
jgi:hypothetical protein